MILTVYKFNDFDGRYKALISTYNFREANMQLIYRTSEMYMVNLVSMKVEILKNRFNISEMFNDMEFSTELFKDLIFKNNTQEVFINHITDEFIEENKIRSVMDFSKKEYQRVCGLDLIEHNKIIFQLKFMFSQVGGLLNEI